MLNYAILVFKPNNSFVVVCACIISVVEDILLSFFQTSLTFHDVRLILDQSHVDTTMITMMIGDILIGIFNSYNTSDLCLCS